jgi:glycyl-tRNA synthetase alpha subunit
MEENDMSKYIIPENLKDRLYSQPDFAVIIKKSQRNIFELELKSLLELGSIYY